VKLILNLLFSLSLINKASAQINVDSLRLEVSKTVENNAKLNSLVRLARYYKWTIPDSTIHFAIQGLPLAKKLKSEKEERDLYFHMGEALSGKGNFALALDAQLKGLKLAEKTSDSIAIAWSIGGTGAVYFYSHEYKIALDYFKRLKNYPEAFQKNDIAFSAFIGEAYYQLGQIDSALAYIGHSYELSLEKPKWPIPFYYMGKIYAKKGDYARSLEFYRTGLNIPGVTLSTIEGYNGIAEIFSEMGNNDSAIYYATNSLILSEKFSFPNKSIESSSILKDVYKRMGRIDSAFKYQEIMLASNDSVYSQEKVKQMQMLPFNEQLKEQEIIAGKEAYSNKHL